MFRASRGAARLIMHFYYDIIYNTIYPLLLHTSVRFFFKVVTFLALIHILRFYIEFLQCARIGIFCFSLPLVKLFCAKQFNAYA